MRDIFTVNGITFIKEGDVIYMSSDYGKPRFNHLEYDYRQTKWNPPLDHDNLGPGAYNNVTTDPDGNISAGIEDPQVLELVSVEENTDYDDLDDDQDDDLDDDQDDDEFDDEFNTYEEEEEDQVDTFR